MKVQCIGQTVANKASSSSFSLSFSLSTRSLSLSRSRSCSRSFPLFLPFFLKLSFLLTDGFIFSHTDIWWYRVRLVVQVAFYIEKHVCRWLQASRQARMSHPGWKRESLAILDTSISEKHVLIIVKFKPFILESGIIGVVTIIQMSFMVDYGKQFIFQRQTIRSRPDSRSDNEISLQL